MFNARTIIRRSVSVRLVFSLVLFCGIAHSQIVSRILNGVETDEFESVGIVGSMALGGYCSGTLITPRHVLTAAHCAELNVSDTDGTFILDGEIYTTSRIVLHPDYDDETLDNDIAIYVLSEDVVDVEPAEIFRDEPMVGDLLTIVGFGGAGTGADGDDGTFGTKRIGTVMIDVVSNTLVSWEFDTEDESNTAPGDSGGPNFLEIDGVFYVAGITSGGTEADAGLGDMAFNTRVDAFQDWIDDTIDAGLDPQEEEPVEEEPTEEEPTHCHGGNGHGHHGHGHGHLGFGGFFLGALFSQLDDYFMDNYNQTFGDWLGGLLDDIFGDGAAEESGQEDPAGESPAGIESGPGAEDQAEEDPAQEDPAEDPAQETPVPGSSEIPEGIEIPGGEPAEGGGAPVTDGQPGGDFAPFDVSGGTNRAVNRLRRIHPIRRIQPRWQ